MKSWLRRRLVEKMTDLATIVRIEIPPLFQIELIWINYLPIDYVSCAPSCSPPTLPFFLRA